MMNRGFGTAPRFRPAERLSVRDLNALSGTPIATVRAGRGIVAWGGQSNMLAIIARPAPRRRGAGWAAENGYVDTVNASTLTCRRMAKNAQGVPAPVGVIPDDQFPVKVLGAYGATGQYVEFTTQLLANCVPKFQAQTVIPIYWDATYDSWYFDGLVIDASCT